MSWVAVGAAAVTAVGSAYSANKSAKAQQKGGDAAIAEQRRQYDQTREDQLPWLQAGQGALGQLQKLNAGDYSGFTDSPDYAYTRDEGMNGINRHLAAKGGFYSGGGDADRMRFLSGLASQNYNTYYNRLANLAGVGQTAANNLGSFGQSAASNIGNAQMANGQARASTYGAYGQGLAGLAGAFNYGYQQNRANNGNTGWYFGNNPGPG